MNFDQEVTFFVSAVTRRRNGIIYRWLLDSVQLQLGESSSYNLSGANFPIGTYTLICRADDGVNSADAKWTVKINGPPSITSVTPTTAISRTSYITPLDFTVTSTDPNSDALVYTWRFDGDATVLTNAGSTGTLTPTATMVGCHRDARKIRCALRCYAFWKAAKNDVRVICARRSFTRRKFSKPDL